MGLKILFGGIDKRPDSIEKLSLIELKFGLMAMKNLLGEIKKWAGGIKN